MCPICARLLQVRRPFSDDVSTADVDLFHQIVNTRLTRPGPLRVMLANNLRGIAENAGHISEVNFRTIRDSRAI